ncbi:probable disease resistance protein At4g27220 [Telopea speciosissima]|uniref:probable disease resistance protein At4g27220 n=1 Tax=Telopea speciosissima TaxID=54955 RepID=UPI001CC6FB2C|nr:probable disease resistance protein At4g27220 [Telopea speciosissima]
MDFVGPFVGVIDSYLIAPFVRQINHLRRSNDNVNGLQTVVQKLKARRNDEQTTLKAEENVGRVKTATASNWFEAVEKIEMEADVIETEYNQGKCAGGWCVNCWSRYKLSKRSASLKLKAKERFDEQFAVARQPALKRVIEMPAEPIINNQPSTQRMLKQIFDCIGDPEIDIIGVYGMGGVGKTTLAKEINNQFKENSCFEIVIMVTVSATPNIPSIQISLGKRLGLPDDRIGAGALFEALRKKKFLIILDDVWSKLKIDDVGIPHPAQNSNGSKILMTSRNQDACTDMGASKTIRVQPLSEAESWEVFVKEAGEHVGADGIKHFAGKIVGRCKGLPLAIVTVAHAMANRHGVGVWENALREMKQSAKDLRGMINEVFVPLKFSFDRLENDLLRSLFLYCACFPEDHDIGVDEMLNYWVGEGLVDKLGSLKAVRDKGEDLIESLKIACMLENGEYKDSVKMHDMMRELALWITSSEYSGSNLKFLIRTGESVKEAPQAHEWVDASRISLFGTQIEELPELGEKMCQNPATLLLRGNRILTAIPPTNFLQHMDRLSVLDLSYSEKLEYIPDSLSCLVNLRVLKLRGCEGLRALPALGMLRQLQVLDLWACTMLDQQILGGGSECVGGASNLRYLDVGWSNVSFQVGVMSRLPKLEELRLWEANKIKWKVKSVGEEDEKWDIGSNITGSSDDRKGQSEDKEKEEKEEKEKKTSGGSSSSTTSSSSSSSVDINDSIMSRNVNINIDVEELFHLTSLTSLSISFEDIIVSDWFKPLAKKMKVLNLRRCTIVKQDALQALNESQNLCFLTIDACLGVTCVPSRVQRSVRIMDCEDLEAVLDGAEDHHQDSFETLDLMTLPKLKRICAAAAGGSLASLNCFAQLRSIFIMKCNSLRMVFTKGMPRLFNNLETIFIRKCEKMEVIIETEEEEVEEVGEDLLEVGIIDNGGGGGVISPFPRLKYLNLEGLPTLADVCTNRILNCPLLKGKDVTVINCPKLKQNPLHIRNAEGLIFI